MKRSRPHLAIVQGGTASEPAPGPSDEELIRAVEEGDSQVAGLLYDRLLPTVDRTLVRVLGRREAEHEDLVQSAFEQIVTTLCRRRFGRTCSLDAWASTLASRVAFNVLRSRTRERRVVDHKADLDDATRTRAGGRDVEREAGTRRQLDRVRLHLSQMSELRATTLFLHDGLGYDLAEIAVLTGASIAAAQSRMVRGRRELQQRMGEDIPAQEDER
jgi:RNA polymerase sigma-70 factor (ECF subfamily)